MNGPDCDRCGNSPDECVCHLTLDFPDDLDRELDTDYLDWAHYEGKDEDKEEDEGEQL